ncbi:hypothetical protein QW060_03060 [Myroides ceti]|uniref:Lipocalin-like domain-containing protein n=1 Tax=Paenimyroides ceti TaxID=395087 RepID=A0ABT8CQS5_9FLAO|nr:hypothetical protein [Paenimyroides ceti]MDN3706101.1 hypothetical protein [Paenimyroides ceti]
MKKIVLLGVLISLFSCSDDDIMDSKVDFYIQQPKSVDLQGFWKYEVKTDAPVYLGDGFDMKDAAYVVFDPVFIRTLYEQRGEYYNLKSDQRYWYHTSNRITFASFYKNESAGVERIDEYSFLYKLNATKDTLFLRSDSLAYFVKKQAVDYTEKERNF